MTDSTKSRDEKSAPKFRSLHLYNKSAEHKPSSKWRENLAKTSNTELQLNSTFDAIRKKQNKANKKKPPLITPGFLTHTFRSGTYQQTEETVAMTLIKSTLVFKKKQNKKNNIYSSMLIYETKTFSLAFYQDTKQKSKNWIDGFLNP